MKVQFVSNAAGEHTAVLVPIKEWERIQQHLQKPAAQQKAAPAKSVAKEQFKADFREAVREMKRGEGQPVEKLLAELREL
jgi:hypothetical protein